MFFDKYFYKELNSQKEIHLKNYQQMCREIEFYIEFDTNHISRVIQTRISGPAHRKEHPYSRGLIKIMVTDPRSVGTKQNR